MGKWEQRWRITSRSLFFLPFTTTVIRACLEINLLKIELLNIVDHKSYLIWHGDSRIASNFLPGVGGLRYSELLERVTSCTESDLLAFASLKIGHR